MLTMMSRPPYRPILVVLAWSLTSFLCHYQANRFLQLSVSEDLLTAFINSLAITALQMIFCIILTNALDSEDTINPNIRLMQLTHALAALATNFSLATTYASTTFAIKLMEPITDALARRIILKYRLTPLQYATLPVIVVGSFLFAEDFSTGFKISFGSFLAVASNILLATRNVILQKQHLSTNPLILEKQRNYVILSIVSWLVIVLSLVMARLFIVSSTFPPRVFFVITSAFLHVGYIYISTAIVLKELSIVENAIGNIFKRLFIVGLFVVLGSREVFSANVCGLFLCAMGLVMYAATEMWSQQTIRTQILDFIGKLKSITRRLLTVHGVFALTVLIIIVVRSSYNKEDPRLKLDTFNFAIHVDHNYNQPQVSSKEALAADLVETPDLADAISPTLTTRREVIAEAQRIHMNIFTKLLAGRKKAMLFHYSPSENKGDSAIAVAEFMFLRKLGVDVIFHCPLDTCTNLIYNSLQVKGNLTNNELVILLHGGGNVIGYGVNDKWRSQVIQAYPDFDIIVFPQSIYIHGPYNHLEYCTKVYASHKSLTFLWRDRVSYKLGKKLFPKVRSLLSPDITYQIGPVERTMVPSYDVLWFVVENPGDILPKTLSGLRVHVHDWLQWPTPQGTSPMEDVFLMTQMGFTFLQRGRIVITDRLHGHILCTLLEIPHIFIDNKEHKILNYHNTWTRSVENIVYTNSSEYAIHQAKRMINKLKEDLPAVVGYFNNNYLKEAPKENRMFCHIFRC